MRDGVWMIASKARSGLTLLRPGFGGPALAEEALGRRSFRAVRDGVWMIASKARSGPFPLLHRVGRIE